MGRREDALSTLAAAGVKFPASLWLQDARVHVEQGTPVLVRFLGDVDERQIAAVQGALGALSRMPLRELALVVSRTTADGLVISEVRAAAAGVTALVPMMRVVELDGCEDDITAVFLRILDARVRFFGWAVPDQSKGGFSGKENPGERDLVLRKDGSVIAVIEAVVCQGNPASQAARKSLTAHFQKLFAYDECRLFFHVVYAYTPSPTDVATVMRDVASSDAPAGFTFARLDELPHEDARPIGFQASYRSLKGQVTVAFLVMDMRQQVQRDAAALAASTRARAKPPSA